MYAVIETGGKQYRVTEGETIPVELLDSAENQKYAFDKVLLVADGDKVEVGQPYLTGKTVSATVLGNAKDKKVTIIKFKEKTGYHRKQGHRQNYTLVKIDKIG